MCSYLEAIEKMMAVVGSKILSYMLVYMLVAPSTKCDGWQALQSGVWVKREVRTVKSRTGKTRSEMRSCDAKWWVIVEVAK